MFSLILANALANSSRYRVGGVPWERTDALAKSTRNAVNRMDDTKLITSVLFRGEHLFSTASIHYEAARGASAHRPRRGAFRRRERRDRVCRCQPHRARIGSLSQPPGVPEIHPA